MFSRRILRGVIAHRQLVAQNSLKSTSQWIAGSARLYSTETGATNGNGKPAEAAEAPEKVIEKLKKELEDSKQELLLAYADRQNSIRIAKDDVRKAKEYGIQKFATSLFDVNDILERALESVSKEKLDNNVDLSKFYDGVRMTEKLMLKVYEQTEIKRFHPLGEKFDPAKHQALQEIPDPSKEPGTVCHVMKAGYQLKDRLLRPAHVVVVKDTRPKDAPKQEGEKKDEPAPSS